MALVVGKTAQYAGATDQIGGVSGRLDGLDDASEQSGNGFGLVLGCLRWRVLAG